MTQEVPPGVFWRSLLHLSIPQFLKFNISLGKDALFGVYIRKGLPPSHAQVKSGTEHEQAQTFHLLHLRGNGLITERSIYSLGTLYLRIDRLEWRIH